MISGHYKLRAVSSYTMAFPTFSRIQNCCYVNKKFADVFVISLGNSFDHLQAAVMFRTTLFCHLLSLQIYRFFAKSPLKKVSGVESNLGQRGNSKDLDAGTVLELVPLLICAGFVYSHCTGGGGDLQKHKS